MAVNFKEMTSLVNQYFDSSFEEPDKREVSINCLERILATSFIFDSVTKLSSIKQPVTYKNSKEEFINDLKNKENNINLEFIKPTVDELSLSNDKLICKINSVKKFYKDLDPSPDQRYRDEITGEITMIFVFENGELKISKISQNINRQIKL